MSVHNWIGFATWLVSAALIVGVVRTVPAFRPSASQSRTYWWRVFLAWVFATAFLYVASTSIANAWARSIVRNRIADAQRNTLPVYVDGRLVADSAAALAQLARLQMIAAHHSHPLESREVRFGDTTLRIARDSERVHEYWVYWPPVSENSAIGRIRSLKLGQSLSTSDGSHDSRQQPPGKAGG